MRTLGIELASSDKDTALCLLSWRGGGATVTDLRVGVSDDAICETHTRADVTGIDCPFGWPEAFRAMVAEHAPAEARWPDARDHLRFRLTDLRVREAIKRWPLSVSSDLIAVPAMRCHLLLRRLGVTDRAGDGRVFEVYPAASLDLWGFPSRGYKGAKGRATLARLVSGLSRRLPWLDLAGFRGHLAATDHAFDALVASLTARAAALRLTSVPAADERPVAAKEGWIALPGEGSLDRLVDVGQEDPE
jgi:hypothetical protein